LAAVGVHGDGDLLTGLDSPGEVEDEFPHPFVAFLLGYGEQAFGDRDAGRDEHAEGVGEVGEVAELDALVGLIEHRQLLGGGAQNNGREAQGDEAAVGLDLGRGAGHALAHGAGPVDGAVVEGESAHAAILRSDAEASMGSVVSVAWTATTRVISSSVV